MNEPRAEHAIWPADRFFWAKVDVAHLTRRPLGRRARERQLDYLVEGELPLPLRDAQIVYTKLDNETVLACAAPRQSLQGLEGVLSLRPISVPSCMDVDVNPQKLNLLVGDCEPLAVKQARRRWLTALLTLWLLVMIIAAISLERRVQLYQDAEERATAHVGDVYAALGYGGDPGTGAARMVAELRELEAGAQNGQARDPRRNVLPMLVSLLGAWPDELPNGFETLALGPRSVTITATVASPTAAQLLAESFRSAQEGWKVMPPQLSGGRGGTKVSLTLQPAEDEE